MAITEICLYSVTSEGRVASCKWREYLDGLGVEYKDLNYRNCDEQGLEECITPLNYNMEGMMTLTTGSFPFVIYHDGVDLIPLTTLDKLRGCEELKNA